MQQTCWLWLLRGPGPQPSVCAHVHIHGVSAPAHHALACAAAWIPARHAGPRHGHALMAMGPLAVPPCFVPTWHRTAAIRRPGCTPRVSVRHRRCSDGCSPAQAPQAARGPSGPSCSRCTAPWAPMAGRASRAASRAMAAAARLVVATQSKRRWREPCGRSPRDGRPLGRLGSRHKLQPAKPPHHRLLLLWCQHHRASSREQQVQQLGAPVAAAWRCPGRWSGCSTRRGCSTRCAMACFCRAVFMEHPAMDPSWWCAVTCAAGCS